MKRYHKKLAAFTLVCGALILSFDGYSQEDEIKGKVVDVDRKPVPGVNVLIKGTSNGTAADKDGNFVINAPLGESILFFSFIGYSTIEQKIKLDKGYSYELKVNVVKDALRFKKGKGSVEIIKHPLKNVL